MYVDSVLFKELIMLTKQYFANNHHEIYIKL